MATDVVFSKSPKEPLVVDVLNAPQRLRQIPIESIKDIRVVGEDLLLLLTSGRQVILQQGGILAFQEPGHRVHFFDGVLTLEQLFRQTEVHDFQRPEKAPCVQSAEVCLWNGHELLDQPMPWRPVSWAVMG